MALIVVKEVPNKPPDYSQLMESDFIDVEWYIEVGCMYRFIANTNQWPDAIHEMFQVAESRVCARYCDLADRLSSMIDEKYNLKSL